MRNGQSWKAQRRLPATTAMRRTPREHSVEPELGLPAPERSTRDVGTKHETYRVDPDDG